MRLYTLDLSPHCQETCHYCGYLHQKSPQKKTPQMIHNSLEKAYHGEYSGIRLPCNLLSLIDWPILQRLAHGRQSVHLDIQSHQIEKLLKEINNFPIHIKSINIIFREYSEVSENHVHLLKKITDVSYTWLVIPPSKPLEQIHMIPPFVSEDVRTLFPIYTPHSQLFTARETNEYLHLFKVARSDFQIKPLDFHELYEPRIDKNQNLEPFITPQRVQQISDDSKRVSVIIPTYNNKNELVLTLKQLSKQTLDAKYFEIIIVDDGSTDETSAMVSDFMDSHPLNIKLLFFPRVRKRVPGDNQFRAGIARNLGVKHALGQIVAFLDSDIATPTHYLSDLIEEHKRYDLVQHKRLHLKSKPTKPLNYDNLQDMLPYTYIKGGDYWKSFYNCENWNQISSPWKYTCTYSLSLKKTNFKKLGWFKKTFCFYGFEDTDLGLRAYKKGLKFHLSSNTIYHIPCEKERDECSQSLKNRRKILSKTAQILFFNHLDTEVYTELEDFMDHRKIETPNYKKYFPKWLNTL